MLAIQMIRPPGRSLPQVGNLHHHIGNARLVGLDGLPLAASPTLRGLEHRDKPLHHGVGQRFRVAPAAMIFRASIYRLADALLDGGFVDKLIDRTLDREVPRIAVRLSR